MMRNPSIPPSGATTLLDVLGHWAAVQPAKRVFTYQADGDGAADDAVRLTYQGLFDRALAVGRKLRALGLAGERALMLYPAGLDFVAAFFGCMAGGVVAVPSHLPRPNRPMPRLRAIVEDARPRVVLTVADLLPDFERWVVGVPELAGLPCLATDRETEGGTEPPAVDPQGLAFLQYTSGSTATPKGVMVTHANLMHNSSCIHRVFGTDPEGKGVCWLPAFHDMGLIGGVLQPIYCGAESVLMSPVSFLQRPVRWLEAISKTGASISGGPNFAYELCARKTTLEQKSGLDLSTWRTAFNGAEPVRPETLALFAEAFGPCGFRKEAFLPCFGLAEATLLVTGKPWDQAPALLSIRGEALERDRGEPADPEAPDRRDLTGSGQAAEGVEIAIVEPETRRVRDDGEVGEIWVRGGSVARGYWERPDATAATFDARTDRGDGPFMRTGDLGFARNGELFVTGRLKDLMIVRGRNIYPQDVEATVERSHPLLRPASGGVFSVEVAGEERVVVVHETDRPGKKDHIDDVLAAVRAAVAEHHEIDLHAIRLVKPLSVPKTSSGKVQRHVCRRQFLDDELEVVAAWTQAQPGSAGVAAPAPAPASVLDAPLSRQAAAIADWLAGRVSALLGADAAALDRQAAFATFGLGSAQAVGIAGDLESFLDRRLPPTLLYEYPSIDALARYLGETASAQPASAIASAPVPPGSEPIAIIGIGCRFPGAHGPDAFWKLLRDGGDAVGPWPPLRDGGSPQPGGFLDRVDHFDADFFGISPREAARMDPQHRLLLETAWEALEDAGLVADRLRGEPVGVFVGLSGNDYGRLLERLGVPGDSHVVTGNAASLAANRLSYVFDWQGPSLAVDTACSSSLVAVHLACQSLRLGESSLAIAGGVNLVLDPSLSEGLNRGGFLAGDGRCKPFDASADGYGRGEGVGLVLLKPLSRAIADGDPIHALIRGGAINQDGRTNGLTAPNPRSQEMVLRAAHRNARVEPGRVDFIEAHGTGTLLGDPIEARALGSVLSEGRTEGRPCRIGSVKANIGHLEAAAGIAGLIKTALAIQHGAVPGTPHFRVPNPHVRFAELGLVVSAETTDWPETDAPRLAGVSSFGFGGTNAHVVLEQAPAVVATTGAVEDAPIVVPLSARDPEALRDLVGSVLDLLASESVSTLALADTAARRRAHHDYRLAVAANSRSELIDRLKAFRACQAGPGWFAGRRKPGKPVGVAFVFGGEGTLWRGAGIDLLESEPAFRSALLEVDRQVRRLGGWSPIAVLRGDDGHRLGQAEFARPTLFALQVAQAAYWRSLGIEPASVTGHGAGAIAAAYVSGGLTLADAVLVAVRSGQRLGSIAEQGGLAVVGLSAAEVERRLNGRSHGLAIVSIDGPDLVTVGGPIEPLRSLVSSLQDEEVRARTLDLDCSPHHPGAGAIRDDLAHDLAGITPVESSLPFVSAIDGQILDGRSLDGGYWSRHVVEPIRFDRALETLRDAGHDVFLELGPTAALHGALRRAVGPERALATLRRDSDAGRIARESLAALHALGASIAWERVHPAGPLVALPTYPWRKTRHWIEPARRDEPKPPGNGAHRNGVHATTNGNGHHNGHAVSLLATTVQAETNGHPHPIAETPSREPLKAADASWRDLPEAARRDWLVEFFRGKIAQVLELDPTKVEPDRPIDTLGIDSLSALELNWAIEELLGRRIPVTDLMGGPTITQLVDRGLAILDEAAGHHTTTAGAATIADSADHPLSRGQESQWYVQQLYPESVAFNMAGAVRIRQPLDLTAIAEAFRRLIDRHPILRSIYPAPEGRPVMRILDAAPTPFSAVDVSGLDEAEVVRRLGAEARQPIALETGPLYRGVVFSRGPDDHFLLQCFHHIIGDFWSIALAMDELGKHYAAVLQGKETGLPTLDATYHDFVRWETEQLEGPQGAADWTYWKDQLAGDLPTLDLPTTHPRPTLLSDRGATRRTRIDRDLTQRFERVASKGGASLYSACLAAYQTLLARLANQDDVIVGSPAAVRNRREFAPVVGFMINTLPMRATFGDDPSFEALLDRVKHAALGALDHSAFPVGEMIGRLDLDRDPSRSPLFQATFVFQKAQRLDARGLNAFGIRGDGARAEVQGLSLESLPLDMQATQFELTLMVAERDGGLDAQLEYRTDLFDGPAIERMLEQFRTLLGSIADHPDRPVSRLDLLPVAERGRVLQEWNRTAADHPRDRCLHQLFEAQAARTPEAVAVTDGSDRWTYRELEERAERLARRLVVEGVGPGSLVGVCLERSSVMVAALLGVLKAGAAYLPLDPTYPAERLAYLLDDGACPIVVTRPSLTARLGDSPARPLFVDGPDAPQNGNGSARKSAAPDDAAYVIYTSGSTGKPKGVMVTHANAVHSTAARLIAYPEPLTGFLLLSSFAFDSSVAGLFWTLAAGGTLVLPPDDGARDPIGLAKWIDEEQVSHLLCVPSLYGLLLSETQPPSLGGLRVAIVAGETCSRALVRRHRDRLPNAALYNEYGPTEASVWCAFARCDDAPDDGLPVPIGRPIPNARVYVLDRHRQPAPIGVIGELYVGGEGVAPGYRNRPELTAEKFVSDPFAHDPTARMYRTGDLARWRPDGQLEFLGRSDNQVKIRGYRIEPGEIGEVLARHPAVRDQAVIVREDRPGDPRLVAYVVPAGELAPNAAELRGWLRGQLPEHMVPALYVILPSLPLSANGKVDHKALPAPDPASTASAGFVAARTDPERALSAIVAEVLELEAVGVEDNLFELGLDSIRGVQVATRARRAGLDLGPADLFRHQTIAELASSLDQPATAALEGPPPVRAENPLADDPAVEDAYPLTPLQQGMLFHSMAAPDSGVYVEQFACELHGPIDVAAFERSLTELFARHPVLRTSIRWLGDDQVVQAVNRSVAAPLTVHDWTRVSAPSQALRLVNLLEDDRKRGLDPSSASLVRIQLVKLAPDRHHLVWSNHHLLMDGWCMPMVLGEALALYDAGRRGQPANLPDRRPYREFVDWLTTRDSSRDETYWKYALAGFRTPTPLGIGRATRHDGPHALREETLSADLTAALVAKGRAHHLTLNTLTQAAWALVLARYSGQDDVVFGVTVSGRPPELPGVEAMIGLFINTLPLRVKVDEDGELLDWLHALQARNLDLRAHEATPLAQVQAWSELPRGRSLFDSILVFENLPTEADLAARARGLGIGRTTFVERTNFPLTLYALPGKELTLRVDFDAERFDTAEIDRLVGHLRTVLQGIAAGAARRPRDLPLLTPSEQAQLLGHQTEPAASNPPLDDDADLPDLDGLSEEELDALIDELT